MFIAKMFSYVDETKTETTSIQKNFENFQTALAWIQSTDDNAAGGEITDQETWNTLYEIDRNFEHQDYRRH